MRSLLFIAAACLMLSACTPSTISKACTDLDAAHTAFVIVAGTTGKVKASTVSKESTVHADIDAACAAATVASAQ